MRQASILALSTIKAEHVWGAVMRSKLLLFAALLGLLRGAHGVRFYLEGSKPLMCISYLKQTGQVRTVIKKYTKIYLFMHIWTKGKGGGQHSKIVAL
jgi:hypothetical protein